MSKPRFLRRNWRRHSELGRRRKKKQKWRSPKGRHSKTREKRGGYPATVSIGYKGESKKRGNIGGKIPVLIYNVRELGQLKGGDVIIIGRTGKRKKLEIVKMAKEKKIQIHNLSARKLNKMEKKI